MRKILLIIGALILLIYLYWSYASWFHSKYFRLSFFDVGQGDSALIVTPGGQTILIDGGPDKKVLRGLGKVLPFWYRKLDLVVITHAHDDHITGLVEVGRRYRIKKILKNNLDFNNPALLSLLGDIRLSKTELIDAQEEMILRFDNDCSLSILSADKDKKSDDNDYSIVTAFDCLERRAIFLGDAGTDIEKELLIKNNSPLGADILKVSHHGSISANSEEFLAAIHPRIAVISVGKNNKFNHPSLIIIDRLNDISARLFRTDQSGTINFLANNKIIIYK